MADRSEVTLGESLRYIRGLFKDNKVVFFGETNHRNPAFKTFFNANMENFKDAGVTDLFVEIPQKFQKHVDAYFAATSKEGEAAALAAHAKESGVYAEQSALLYAAKQKGIRVHYTDVGLNEEETKAWDIVKKYQYGEAYKTKGVFDYKKLTAEDKKEYDPAYDTFFAQRERANAEWVKIVEAVKKEYPDGKFAMLGGDVHARRKYIEGVNQPDVNELLADKVGKTAYVRLEASKDASLRIVGAAQLPKPKNPTEEIPDAVISVPDNETLKALGKRDKVLDSGMSEPQKEKPAEPAAMTGKLTKAVTDYAKVRFTDLATGEVNQPKADEFVKRYGSMMAKYMGSKEQDMNADDIIAKTAKIKKTLGNAATLTDPDMRKAVDQARAMMQEVDAGIITPADAKALAGAAFTPAGIKSVVKSWRE